jgi:hypothetical protein
MAIAGVLHLTSDMLFVLPVTVLSAVLLLRTGQNTKIKGDAAIAMISVGALAVGYLLLNHGNGFTMFDGGKVILQSGEPDFVVVANYIRDDLKGVIGDAYESPYGQGRIVAVEEPIH